MTRLTRGSVDLVDEHWTSKPLQRTSTKAPEAPIIADGIAHGTRHQDGIGVGRLTEAGCRLHRGSEQVLAVGDGLSDIDADPHAQFFRGWRG